MKNTYKKMESLMLWEIGVLVPLLTGLFAYETCVLSLGGIWGIAYFMSLVVFHMGQFTLCLQFTNFIMLLKFRFRTLNQRLQKSMFENGRPVDIFGMRAGGRVVAGSKRGGPGFALCLRRLRSTYVALAHSASSVGAAYDVQMLCLFANSFITSTSVLYAAFNKNALWHVRYPSSALPLVEAIFYCWAIICILQTVVVMAACSAAVAEAERTSAILERASAAAPLPGLQLPASALAEAREVRHFAAQAQALRLRFSACGLFNIDLSLACSMAQAVASYIVIMMQFHSQNDLVPEHKSYVKQGHDSILERK